MDEKNNSVEQTEVPTKNQETVETPKEAKVDAKAFTEEQVEAIVQRRLDRYKKTVSNKLDGVDIEEAKKLITVPHL